jgi:hypothetical protein
MSESLTSSGKYAYEYSHAKWSIVSNPVFDEDWGVEEMYPGNFGYSPVFISQAVDIFTDDAADKPSCKYPYLVQIRVTSPMEVICVTDTMSLFQLWDMISVIFTLEREEKRYRYPWLG